MLIRRILCCCLFVFLLAGMTVWAQGTTSRIAGTVTDSGGSLIAGATVTAINEGTDIKYATVSGSRGEYTFDSIPIGTYTVRVDAPGFKAFVSKGNVLSIGLPTTVNALLRVGATDQTVEVHGGYDLIQTETSGNFGNVIDSKTLTDLPIVGLRGRNPLALVTTVPGVVENGANATGGGVSVHGSRDRAWNYTLDGIDINESSSGGGNSSPTKINPDSVAEFRVITANFTPEFGRNSGGQVVMVTKSGTNSFHGNAFWFYQSPFLRANDASNKSAVPPLPKTQFVQNIGGGSVSGPVFRNKTFFFLNIQLLHAYNSAVVTRTVYTDAAKSGIYRYAIGGRNLPFGSTGATVDAKGNPASGVNIGTYNIAANDPLGIGLDPAVKKYLGLTPSPNTFTVGDGLNTAGYSFVAPQLEKQVDSMVKIDHTFNTKNAIFGRWYSGHQNSYGDSANSGYQTFPGAPNQVNTLRTPRNLALGWRFTPTAKTTNEFVVGMNRFGYEFVNPGVSEAITNPFNFNNSVTSPRNSYLGNSRFLTTYQLADNFTLVKGTHVLKWGINFRYGRQIDHRGSVGSLNALPQVLFDTATNPVDTTTFKLPSSGLNATYDLPILQSSINDMLGRVGQIQQGYVSQADSKSFKPAGSLLLMDHRWPEYDFYIQDTWKILPNLTLDYGVRLDARMAPTMRGFTPLVPDQPVAFGAVPSGSIKFVPGKLYNDDWNNFGPSIGFAWDPFKNGKTSLRGHYRVAFDRINSFSFSSTVFQGMPGLTYQQIDTTSGQAGMRAQGWKVPATPTGLTPMDLRQPPAYSTNAVTVSDPEMRIPKVYQWGLSLQQQVARNTVFTLSYVGNHGVGLYGGYDANPAEFRSNGFLDAFKTVQGGGESALFDKLFSADSRRKSGESGAAFARRTYASNLTQNNVAGLASTVANRLQGGVPLVVSDGLSPYFFRPYPQYLGGLRILTTRDFSNYNGMEAQLERRFSNGLLFQVSYTWSKSQDVRSFDPTFTTVATGSSQSALATPFNIYKPRMNYGPSDFDRTGVIQYNWVYHLPFGKKEMLGKSWNRAVDTIFGGWEVAGVGVWETGRPITFLSGSNTYSSLVQTPASCTGCSPKMGKIYFDKSAGQKYYLTPAQRAQFFVPAPGEFSNVGRNYFRQAHVANLNATVSKNFHLYREHTLQTRLEMQNITNSVYYDTFGSQVITSSVFTRLNAAVDGVLNNSARRMQLALKYNF